MKMAALGVAAGLAGVVAITKKFVQAAAFQEKQQKTLAAAMKQAGTFTEEAMQHNLDYAASLQKMTTFGDEAILGVQKMLTNFGVEGEMLDKLTKATLDLAAAKGMDLKSAADLVAKSVGSSTNALTRYGIEVKGAVGSTERMGMAVDNITKLFGGAAAAEADTFSGKVAQMKNALGDLAEVIGSKLFPVLTPMIEGITKLVTGGDDLKTSTSNLIPLYETWQTTLKNTKGNVKGLSDEQAALNSLQEANARLAFFEGLENINDAYEDQKDIIADLNKDLEKNEALNKQINDGLVDLMLDEKEWAEIEAATRELSLDRIKIQQKMQVATQDMEKSITNLAMAELALKDVNVESLIIEPELRQAVIDRTAAIQDGTFKIKKQGEAVIEVNKASVASTKVAAKDMTKTTKDMTDKMSFSWKKHGTAVLSGMSSIASSASSIASSIVDIERAKYDAIDEADVDAKAKAKQELIKALKAQKIALYAENVINTALGATKAFTSLAGIPVVGPVLGGIAAAAAAAAGALNGNKIRNQEIALAHGGDFVTDGPQQLTVGDNPSGRERVTVTPEEDDDVGGSGGNVFHIGQINVTANNPDEFGEQMKEFGIRTARRA
jgi:hypothetical protein